MADPSKDTTVTATSKLVSRADWHRWYTDLRYQADFREVWQLIDPEQPAPQNNYRGTGPDFPDYATLLATATADLEADHKAWDDEKKQIVQANSLRRPETRSTLTTPVGDLAPQTAAPQLPIPPEPRKGPAKASDIKDDFTIQLAKYNHDLRLYQLYAPRYAKIFEWVNHSVSSSILTPIKTELRGEGLTLWHIVKRLKEDMAPTNAVTVALVRNQYSLTLKLARDGKIKPLAFIDQWRQALADARMWKIAEIDGSTGVLDFLSALEQRLAPQWARQAKIDYIQAQELGNTPLTLDQLGRLYQSLLGFNAVEKGAWEKDGIYAVTYGDRSDDLIQLMEMIRQMGEKATVPVAGRANHPTHGPLWSAHASSLRSQDRLVAT